MTRQLKLTSSLLYLELNHASLFGDTTYMINLSRQTKMNLIHENVRSAIVRLLENDAYIMHAIITSASKAIINNILKHSAFTTKLAESVIGSQSMENVRPQVYELCKMDFDESAEITAALHAQIANMERSHQTLTDELDELEHNCLVFHRLP